MNINTYITSRITLAAARILRSVCYATLTLALITMIDVSAHAQDAGLEIDTAHSVLFGQSLSGEGSKLMWLPRKSALRAGALSSYSSTYWDADSIGLYSVAFGRDNKTTGRYSMVWGYRNTASGYAATAWGYLNTASGRHSTTWGDSNTGGGEDATAWGYLNTASHYQSTAWGRNNVASGTRATVWGRENKAQSTLETTLGQYADTLSHSNATTWEDDDQLLAVGNGTADDQRNNAFTIMKSGEAYFYTRGSSDSSLYIGHGQGPKYGMNGTGDFNPGVTGDDNGMIIESIHSNSTSSTESSGIYLDGDHVVIWSPGHQINSGGDGRLLSVWDEDDGGTEKWYINASGTAMTAMAPMARIKSTKTINSALQKVQHLRGAAITHTEKHNSEKNSTQSSKMTYSLIAQEVEKILPNLVETNGAGDKYMNYNGLLPVVIEAIKEQQTIIDTKDKQINDLQTRLSQLEATVARLVER